MKKIFILSLLAGVIGLTSCNPVEDDYKTNQSYITADQLKAASSVTVYQENGKNINYVHFTSTASAPLQWTNGTTSKASPTGDIEMLITGQQKLTVVALEPDGTTISADFPVNIEVISPNHPVAPQWGFLCGSGEKTWVWDNQIGQAWGNMGYLSAAAGIGFTTTGGWWGSTSDALGEQITKYKYSLNDSGNATMTFSLNKSSLTKSSGGIGAFSFDMSKTTKVSSDKDDLWSVGKLYTSGDGILFPVQINTGLNVSTLDINYLDSKYMVLTSPKDGAASWGEATVWRFKSK